MRALASTRSWLAVPFRTTSSNLSPTHLALATAGATRVAVPTVATAGMSFCFLNNSANAAAEKFPQMWKRSDLGLHCTLFTYT
jgi:hypothetical protein